MRAALNKQPPFAQKGQDGRTAERQQPSSELPPTTAAKEPVLDKVRGVDHPFVPLDGCFARNAVSYPELNLQHLIWQSPSCECALPRESQPWCVI